MMQLGQHTNTELDVGLLRHMILNQIRFFNTKFRQEYGEMVIACDNRHYWRKKAFPFYKARRKVDRAASDLDWDAIFKALHEVRAELKEYFPYRVIEVEGAEADDIIGSLCHKFGNLDMNFGEKIMIVSGDKDFLQLQCYQNVFQYNPTQKKKLVEKNPGDFLLEHIIRGDTGDGVPNMLSDDDTLVTEGKRQTPITAKKLETLKNSIAQDILSDRDQRNYFRNLELISLECIPHEIQELVMAEYEAQSGKGRAKLFNYFIKFKLKNLQQNIGEF
jgi:hypothetical protein